jgi:threonine aldolase
LQNGRHAIAMAEKLKKIFLKKGYEFYLDSPTNQQFVIFTKKQMQTIGKKVVFDFWENLADGRTVVRFATSWATLPENVDKLEDIL